MTGIVGVQVKFEGFRCPKCGNRIFNFLGEYFKCRKCGNKMTREELRESVKKHG